MVSTRYMDKVPNSISQTRYIVQGALKGHHLANSKQNPDRTHLVDNWKTARHISSLFANMRVKVNVMCFNIPYACHVWRIFQADQSFSVACYVCYICTQLLVVAATQCFFYFLHKEAWRLKKLSYPDENFVVLACDAQLGTVIEGALNSSCTADITVGRLGEIRFGIWRHSLIGGATGWHHLLVVCASCFFWFAVTKNIEYPASLAGDGSKEERCLHPKSRLAPCFMRQSSNNSCFPSGKYNLLPFQHNNQTKESAGHIAGSAFGFCENSRPPAGIMIGSFKNENPNTKNVQRASRPVP